MARPGPKPKNPDRDVIRSTVIIDKDLHLQVMEISQIEDRSYSKQVIKFIKEGLGMRGRATR